MAQKQITTEAQELSERADREVERATEKFAELQLPDPSWAKLYAPQEIERRQEEKITTGQKTLGLGLESVRDKIDELIETYRREIDKLTHPLGKSVSPIDQDRARWLDDKARELVRIVGLRGLRAEYDQAMRDGDVELASSIIDWGERFQDPDDPTELSVMMAVKKAHIEALQFQDRLDSMRALRKKRGDVELRLKMIAAGYAPDLKQNSSPDQFVKALRASGVAADSVTW